MARGRFLSISIADDDRLSKLSLVAELLFLKTVPHLDRDGMISGKAGYLWGKVCPLREDLMPEMQKSIDEWIAVGLVIRMTTDKGPVLFFPGFLKNNTLLHYDRETPSKFPVPPGYERTEMGLVVEGTEQKKKPTKKPKETQVPPSSNGNGVGVHDSVNEQVNDLVIDFASKGEVEVKDQVKDQVQVEDQAATRARDPEPTAPAAAFIPPEQDEELDPKALIADLRQRQFMYFDKDAFSIAARLIADYGWERVMEAAETAQARHLAKINDGKQGISSPLAYIRSVLEGTGNGSNSNGTHRGHTEERSEPEYDPGYDPEIQRQFDEHVAKRKAEGSLYYQ